MKPLIIVEVGHNFNGNLEIAKGLIWSAKENGADIAKFQLYDIDTIKKPGDSHYEELKAGQIGRDAIVALAKECDKAGIEFMASAFDRKRVEWLEDIGVKRHKIASRSIFDRDLISAMEDTEKPIIASLAAWNKPDLPDIKKAQFLFCLTRKQVEQFGVQDFPKKFTKLAGFSDHTIGLEWAKTAIDRGAKIIEKHFTFDKNLPGCDQAASMTPKELKELSIYAQEKE